MVIIKCEVGNFKAHGHHIEGETGGYELGEQKVEVGGNIKRNRTLRLV